MKVILIKNAVETLGYFSEQLAETFQEMGHDTYFVDYDDLVNTVDGHRRMCFHILQNLIIKCPVFRTLPVDFPVHVFGANWEKLDCSSHDYIIKNGREVDSVTCAEAIADARISLNVMPWFKDGTHDRVFTAMLQHTLSLTDDSRYLRENFTDKKELVFYSLEKREELPELVKKLLEKPEKCMEIAERGYESAVQEHTWKQRAEAILMDLVK